MCFVQYCMWCRVEYNANAAQRLSQMESVYYYFLVWAEKDETGVSVLDKVLHKLVKQIRNEDLRRIRPPLELLTRKACRMLTRGRKRV